jgi:DNA-binding protein HU-beta
MINKAGLARSLAERCELPVARSTEVLDTLLELMKEALAKGEDVQIRGFGSFTVKQRAARTAKNPRTGEPLEVKASKVVNFKSAGSLKGLLNDE